MALRAALQEIDVFVRRIDQNVDAIATAAKEQAIGLREINKAVNDLDRMTQENAAMNERTTDISRALAEGADALAALVSLFKLNRRTAPRGAKTSVQPRHARGEGTPARRSFAA